MMRTLLFTIGLFLAFQIHGFAEIDLTTLSLEDLMEIDVSLAFRTHNRLFDTPAAVYVLTRSAHVDLLNWRGSGQ